MTEPQEALIKHAQGRDVMFRCDLCDFVAYGPADYEAHVMTAHAVPVEQASGVPDTAGAIPVPRKCGRPKKAQDVTR